MNQKYVYISLSIILGVLVIGLFSMSDNISGKAYSKYKYTYEADELVKIGILKKTSKDCSYNLNENYDIEFIENNIFSIKSHNEAISYATFKVTCDCNGVGNCHLHNLGCVDLCWGECSFSISTIMSLEELLSL